jgi:hypothetical protein
VSIGNPASETNAIKTHEADSQAQTNYSKIHELVHYVKLLLVNQMCEALLNGKITLQDVCLTNLNPTE